MNWKGVALVTGASSGIGAEFARQLAARGSDLIITARRAARLESVAAEIRAATRRSVRIITADLAEGPAALLAKLDQTPDLVINNAGRGLFKPIIETSPADALGMLRLNIESVTLISRELGLRMAARGSGGIINIASTAGYQPIPNFAIYAATKAYVISFTESLNAELCDKNVRVMTCCPGPVSTGFGDAASIPVDYSPFSDTAETCVRRTLRAYEDGAITYVDGPLNALGAVAARFIPRNILTRFITTATSLSKVR